jgi:hypothetical protein
MNTPVLAFAVTAGLFVGFSFVGWAIDAWGISSSLVTDDSTRFEHVLAYFLIGVVVCWGLLLLFGITYSFVHLSLGQIQ